MHKLLVLVICAVFFSSVILGQSKPKPCESTLDVKNSCGNTCLVCDLNGVIGSASDDFQFGLGDPLPGCTSSLGPTYAFAAYSREITFRVSISNCTTTPGGEFEPIRFVGYEVTSGDNCQSDPQFPIFPCSNGSGVQGDYGINAIEAGESREFTATDLEIGKIYYVEVQRSGPTACDFEITIPAGNTKVPPLDAVSYDGPLEICAGSTESYEVLGRLPGVYYYFTLDGDTLERQEHIVNIDWNTPGDYELCLVADNICYQAEPDCRTVRVYEPSISTQNIYLCTDTCYVLPDEREVCEAGRYTLLLSDQQGCDSLVTVIINSAPSDTTYLEATLCTSDSLFFDMDTIVFPGNYEFTYKGYRGCDSTVLLTVSWEDGCSFETFLSAQPLSCAESKDGVISVFVGLGANFPINYELIRLGDGVIATGSLESPYVIATIVNLDAGTYLLRAMDVNDNLTYDNALITRPSSLHKTVLFSEYNGFQISCNDGQDGWIEVIPSGGTPPYRYQWERGNHERRITGLSAGQYIVTITDNNGCKITAEPLLNAPQSIQVKSIIQPTDCFSPLMGGVVIDFVKGGVSPYDTLLFDVNGDQISEFNISSLPIGTYQLRIGDRNNCFYDTLFTLTPIQLPQIELRVQPERPDLGEEVRLSVINSNVDSLCWPEGVVEDCRYCYTATYFPIQSEVLVVKAKSRDGCVVEDSVDLLVIQRQNVFIPSAFSPNGDGVNDIFRPFGGRAVNLMRSLKIYDRWGGEVYYSESNNIIEPPYWDGTSKSGDSLPNGLYSYHLTVSFLNGSERLISGLVNLIR